MPKLRKVAALAAVVGGVSMLGAGTASAHDDKPKHVTIQCIQNTGDKSQSTAVVPGVVAINLNGVLNGGDADSSANQQICGNNNKDNEAEGGDSEGGEGLDLL